MTVNKKKSHLGYLSHPGHSIDKKSVDTDYSGLTEEIEMKPKSPKFKVGDRVRITK